MNRKFATIMLMGICSVGLALGTTNASASDLSRFFERSRVNVAYGNGVGYPNYYAGYASPYRPQYYAQPQYVPQYGPQWGGYGAVAPVPQYGYGVNAGYRGQFGNGDRYCQHNYGGNWGRGF